MGSDAGEKKIVAQHLSSIERRNLSRIKCPLKMYFKNEGEIKTFSRCAEGERIHYHQTCITRNEKKENYTKWQSGSVPKK